MSESVATQTLAEWMASYQKAWESNERQDIAALFAERARYLREPYSAPIEGRDAIVANWLAHRDAPGNHTFMWQPLVETPELTIVTGVTDYPGDTTYSNLWVIRFDGDGRAQEFTEWWMDQSKPS